MFQSSTGGLQLFRDALLKTDDHHYYHTIIVIHHWILSLLLAIIAVVTTSRISVCISLLLLWYLHIYFYYC